MSEKIKINRLKVVLAEKDVNQKDFAEKLSVTAHTISQICNNNQQPTLKTLRKMAIALDVDIRELLVPTKEK
jgi:transcriptional regulator with XRE-family HTH domain